MLGGIAEDFVDEASNSLLRIIARGFNKISDFESLPLYRQLEKPNLNAEKLKSIGDQLDLEQKARMSFNNRKIHGNYMFNLVSNPFTDEFKAQNSPKHAKKKSQQIDYDDFGADFSPKQQESPKKLKHQKHTPSKVMNIIDEIRKFRDKKAELRGNMSKPLRDVMSTAQDTSCNIQKYVAHPKRSTSPIRQKQKIKTKISKQKSLIKEHQINFDDAMDFAQIINLKDKSYFLYNQKIGNLFKFATHLQKIKEAGRSRLDSYYFCHNSMKDVVQKRKFVVYRDISRLARHLILEIRPTEDKSNFMELNESNLSLEEPNIDGILSVSAGRIKPDELFNAILQDSKTGKDDQMSTTTIHKREVQYPENTTNTRVISNDDGNINQAKQFLSLSLEENELRYRQRLTQDINLFKQTLLQQKRLLTLNIFDRRLSEQHEEKRMEQLSQLFYIKIADRDRDRLIRRNKISKDRNQELKIKSLIEVAKIQKQHNNSVSTKMLYKSKSKSKTPTKYSTKPN